MVWRDWPILKELYLDYNQIANIDALAGLDNLTRLELNINQIVNIDSLASLESIHLLYLDSNSIVNIYPLVLNQYLAQGDTVDLSRNPLIDTIMDPLNDTIIDTILDYRHYIDTLEERGVEVFH